MSPDPPSSLLAGVRVLVVEDHEDTRCLTCLVLELAGAEVTSAPGGRAALELVKANVPDVLLSDIAMPEGDGLWLIREVRALEVGGDIPAVAVTALVDADDRRRILAAGYTAHVPKAAAPEDLVLIVRRLARRGALPGEGAGRASPPEP